MRRFETFVFLVRFAALCCILSACGSPPQTIPATSTTPRQVTAAVSRASQPQMQANGTVASLGNNEFTLQTGLPHGYIDVDVNSSTQYTNGKPVVGDWVSVTGSGSWQTFILAYTVVRGASPSPSPSSNPSFPPNGPSTTTMMISPPGKFGLAQIFDEYNENVISTSEASADGPRYGVIWGARPGLPPYWHAHNSSLVATYYMPQETDASPVGWGDAGHNLSWWEANHPDWILYACTPTGSPTKTPAYLAQLTNNVPLDIRNPDVVDYQIEMAATYAIAEGYNGLAFDQVVFSNPTGSELGAGYYGCGIYSGDTFVRRYTAQNDPAWIADTIAWVKQAHAILGTDPSLKPYEIKLVVNHPAGSISDPNEQAMLSNTDAILDEVGFSDYGNYKASFSLFKTTTDWMRYAQAHGSAPLLVDKFEQSTPLAPTQIEYVLATYMMGNEGGSGVFAGNSTGYGAEQYLPQYQDSMGEPCGDYYGDPKSPTIWYRSYAGALAIVNGGSTTPQLAHLPTNHTYVDIIGRPVSNPLSVASGDAYVLLTTNGCH